MNQICNKNCNEIESPGLDQGFTHHIITFKTNHVYVDKKNIELDLILDQTLKVLEDNDHVCFNT